MGIKYLESNFSLSSCVIPFEFWNCILFLLSRVTDDFNFGIAVELSYVVIDVVLKCLKVFCIILFITIVCHTYTNLLVSFSGWHRQDGVKIGGKNSKSRGRFLYGCSCSPTPWFFATWTAGNQLIFHCIFSSLIFCPKTFHISISWMLRCSQFLFRNHRDDFSPAHL